MLSSEKPINLTLFLLQDSISSKTRLIGYVRKLLAVDDVLEFFAPEPKKTDVEEINRYNIAGFLSNDIEIFQITDSDAVCKFEDIAVSSYKLDQEGRDRIRAIMKQEMEDGKTEIGWGHQIRSYVLDQSRIKDLRTGMETGNTQAFLDGDIDAFISAQLMGIKRGESDE